MKNLNSLIKIIFGIVLLINILKAKTEIIEIISDDVYYSSAEEFINHKYQEEKISEIKNSNIDSFILKIGIKPKNAEVKLINYYKHNYKWAMKLPQGKYEVLVSRKGYISQDFIIDLNKNMTKSIKLKRTKKNRVKRKIKHTKKVIPKRKKIRYCSLRIEPNIRGAHVYITNIMPKYKSRIKLPCGRTYNIKVTKKGYRTRRFSTHLLHNEAIPVNLRR